MESIFGIDVSKAKSNEAVLIGSSFVAQFEIKNDRKGFDYLDNELNSLGEPKIIFEATGVYSRGLAAYLTTHNWHYTQINPLAAKKIMDGLRTLKTDKIDAKGLALAMAKNHYKETIPEAPVYVELRLWERIYQDYNEDLVRTKNRLHRALQIVFPALERVLGKPNGSLYWQIVAQFAHPELVQETTIPAIADLLPSLTNKRMTAKRALKLATHLSELADNTISAECIDGPDVQAAQELAHEAERLAAKKDVVIAKMAEVAKNLPEVKILESIPGVAEKSALCIIGELGDLNRFHSSNAINAYIGIDLTQYDSGEHIGQQHIRKRGNAYARKILYKTVLSIISAARTQPTNISNVYNRKKQSAQFQGTKKIAIAAMARLIRTIYHLVRNNEPYDPNKFLAE